MFDFVFLFDRLFENEMTSIVCDSFLTFLITLFKNETWTMFFCRLWIFSTFRDVILRLSALDSRIVSNSYFSNMSNNASFWSIYSLLSLLYYEHFCFYTTTILINQLWNLSSHLIRFCSKLIMTLIFRVTNALKISFVCMYRMFLHIRRRNLSFLINKIIFSIMSQFCLFRNDLSSHYQENF